MSMETPESLANSGFWERRESRYPMPISRHLWELVMPAFLQGTRTGFSRYGCAIDYFDVARVHGRRYFKVQFVGTPEKLKERQGIAERVWKEKLWRQDCAAWPAVKESFRRRLLAIARRDPQAMSLPELQASIAELRRVLFEGTLQHFVQQPASMVPVGDWVRRTHERTGASVCEIVNVLQSCRSGLSDCTHMVDEIAAQIHRDTRLSALLEDHSIHPAARLEQLREASPDIRAHLDAYLEEYGDRVITGFDIVDATLRELPGCTLSLIASRVKGLVSDPLPAASRRALPLNQGESSAADFAGFTLPLQRGSLTDNFEEGLDEAKAAYGLHDEDVRTTYLWPLGLMRRAILAAADHLVARGSLADREDVFQTTPAELDALLAGTRDLRAEEISRRTEEWLSWADEEPPLSFGEKPPLPCPETLGEACSRITTAILFYLDEMEGHETCPIQPASNLMLQGLAASPGSYEGRARIVRRPSDLAKVSTGDVLVAQTTSPAYNVILPSVGALVTSRGGILCHAAIIAREFSVPAVVGIDHATLRIPDGARVLVDGSRGLVAIQG